jgi:hypothetical protein
VALPEIIAETIPITASLTPMAPAPADVITTIQVTAKAAIREVTGVLGEVAINVPRGLLGQNTASLARLSRLLSFLGD